MGAVQFSEGVLAIKLPKPMHMNDKGAMLIANSLVANEPCKKISLGYKRIR